MKKQLSVLFLLLGLIFVSFSFSTNALAIENDTSYENGQIIFESDSLDKAYFKYTTEELSVLMNNTDINTDNSINPLADELTKSKTIIKTYLTHDDIPNSYFYDETTLGIYWSGILPLVKTEKVSGGWKATFSGKLYAYVE
ncbi:MAG: hypothetical protein ABS960_05255 [Solibacillus isronensis]